MVVRIIKKDNEVSFAGTEIGLAAGEEAKQHADAVSPDWSKTALSLFRKYASESRAPFTTVDAWTYAEANGLPTPPTRSAYGPIIKSLQTEGLIRFTGGYAYSPIPAHHGRPLKLWEKA